MRGDDVYPGSEQLPHAARLTLPPTEKSEIREFYGDWLSVLDLKREKKMNI